jgi:hypothetical protein
MAQNCCLLIFLVGAAFIFTEGGSTHQPNVTVRISNMTETMKQNAIRITKQAFIKFNGYSIKSRSSLAQYIRHQFDQLDSPPWQCILGKDFALGITTENEKRIILDVDKVAVLIFKGKC